MKTQGGFTLIELLVVIAILAVLFGVTALALNGVGSNAEAVTASAEQDVVQTAIDVFMAQNSGVLTPTTGSDVQVGPSTLVSGVGFGTYLRRPSAYFYSWTANGTLTQGAKVP
jgi:type IV pilus assembly protein PilA